MTAASLAGTCSACFRPVADHRRGRRQLSCAQLLNRAGQSRTVDAHQAPGYLDVPYQRVHAVRRRIAQQLGAAR